MSIELIMKRQSDSDVYSSSNGNENVYFIISHKYIFYKINKIRYKIIYTNKSITTQIWSKFSLPRRAHKTNKHNKFIKDKKNEYYILHFLQTSNSMSSQTNCKNLFFVEVSLLMLSNLI